MFRFTLVVILATTFARLDGRQIQRSDDDTLTVQMCYFCDDRCNDVLDEFGVSDKDSFYEGITSDVSLIIEKLDPRIKLVYNQTVFYPNPINFAGYVDNANGNKLDQTNMGFWYDTGLFAQARDTGCEAAFATVQSSDLVFQDTTDIGVANMMSICGQYSHGVVALYPTGVESELLAHEVAHVLGIYHDGEITDDYKPYKDMFSAAYPAEWGDLETYCTVEATSGTNYIMNPVPLGSDHDFSECSKAYFRMFLRLAEDYPSQYSVGCMNSELAKRAADLAGRDDESVPMTLLPKARDDESNRPVTILPKVRRDESDFPVTPFS